MPKGKTILITGASSGFGRDMAETLARAGYTVFASMRGVNGKHRDQANDLAKQGIGVVELDVTNDASVDAAVKEVLAHTRRIDVLVNNAGIASTGVTEAFTAEQAKLIFNTNVVGLLRTSRAVLPTMRAQGDGLIVNVGSILGRVTFPFFGIYGASKFAVEALTESLRYELSSSVLRLCSCSRALIRPTCMPRFSSPPMPRGPPNTGPSPRSLARCSRRSRDCSPPRTRPIRTMSPVPSPS